MTDANLTRCPKPRLRLAVHAQRLPFLPAPHAGMTRRWLDGDDASEGATAIVRVDPGVPLPSPPQGAGEELLVLDGAVQDARGGLTAGYYVRRPLAAQHPPGFSEGCTLLLKTSAFSPRDRTEVALDTAGLPLRADPTRPGIHAQVLFRDSHEDVRIERWSAGVAATVEAPCGLELFVLDGAMVESGERFEAHSWLRLPGGSVLRARAAMEGCRVWIKRWHPAPPPDAAPPQ